MRTLAMIDALVLCAAAVAALALPRDGGTVHLASAPTTNEATTQPPEPATTTTTSTTPPPPETTTTTTAPGIPGEQTVTYDGVQLTVPGSWPVVDGAHASYCDGPFVGPPTVFLGPQSGFVPSCPASGQGGGPPPRDGVFMQPDTSQGSGPTVTTPSGQAVFGYATGTYPPDQSFTYHGVSVEIGTGPDPSVARAIFDSLAFDASAPDTPVQEACARNPDPTAMPAPERLQATMELEQGNDTLDPPGAADQALIPAEYAWNHKTADPNPLERFRIVLARLSAKFPATINPDGSTTPEINDELVWAVLAQPDGTTTDCGRWGLDAVDARTGAWLFGGSWSPGP